MTRRYTASVLIFMGFFVFMMGMSSSLWATPYEVTLFPGSARVYERGNIALSSDTESRTGTLLLPGQADPSTLTFVPAAGITLLDISSRKISSIDSRKLAALRQKLATREKESAGFKARSKGLTARINFWESQRGTPEASLEKLETVAAAMTNEIQKAMISLDQIQSDSQKNNVEIKKLKNRIRAIEGNRQTRWELTIRCTPGKGETLKGLWSYEVRGCGWTPVYRVEALPAANTVHFTWKARIHQSTGVDWEKIRLFLATGRTTMRPTPPSIHPWILQPVKPALFDTKRVMLKEAGAPQGLRALSKNEEVRQPVLKAKTTYAVWEMGTRDLAAGDDILIPVREQTWPADFAYTLRPSVGAFGFLHTSVTLEEPLDLPRGKALFLVDGAFLNTRPFAFSGKKLDLFFGPDPQVSCKVVLNDKKTGKSGVFSKKQTWKWDWDLIVTNNKSVPVTIRVEEPAPLSRDTDIAVTVVTKPDVVTQENPEIMVWLLALKPQTNTTITLHVEAQAPGNMNVDPGRRW